LELNNGEIDLWTLESSYGCCTTLLVIHSILMAIQNTQTAYASVVLHAIGKGLGLIWAPCVMFLFPLDNFGFVFGFMQMASIPIL